MLDVTALAGTIDNPSGSSGDKGDRWLLPSHEATKLRSPLCGHAAN
jgi:hypothetical protein